MACLLYIHDFELTKWNIFKGGLNWNSFTLGAHYIAAKNRNCMSVYMYLISHQ